MKNKPLLIALGAAALASFIGTSLYKTHTTGTLAEKCEAAKEARQDAVRLSTKFGWEEWDELRRDAEAVISATCKRTKENSYRGYY